VVGDFNLYRSPNDRNKPGADFAEMFMFNEPISKLGLVELPLRGKRFTWTNKQESPLLERLDWFFFMSQLDPKIPQHSCHHPNQWRSSSILTPRATIKAYISPIADQNTAGTESIPIDNKIRT
jgi:hypothetical protein